MPVPLLEALVPGLLVYVMATAGLMALPEVLAGYRESGYLRRLRISPLRPWQILGAHAANHLVLCTAGSALLVGTAVFAFDLRPPDAPVIVVAAVLLGSVSLLTTGFLLASVLPTTRTTQAVAAAIYFPMIFLSGALFPREVLPDLAADIGRFLPMTHAVDLIRAAWSDMIVDWTDAVILGVFGVLCVAVSVRTFRWEPGRG